MRISILCSDISHPVYPKLEAWKIAHSPRHEIELVSDKLELRGGDLLFLISCHQFIEHDIRRKYGACLVIHASDLPAGRGWSPYIWSILAGQNDITVSLIEAEDEIDSGDIWSQEVVRFAGHELADEIGNALFEAEIRLMNFAVEHHPDIKPAPQPKYLGFGYPRRSAEDSRLDPHKSIADQFDLIRVADPKRYPSFFDFRGCRYKVVVSKVEGKESSVDGGADGH